MILVFVRNPAEVDAANSRFCPSSLYLCANVITFQACQKLSLNAKLLDDESVRSHFQKLSAWGLERTFEFIDRVRGEETSYLFYEASFMTLQSFFVQFLKYCLTIDLILDAEKFDELFAFDDGRSLFTVTLQAYLPQARPSLRLTVISLPEISPPRKKMDFKAIIYAAMTRWCSFRAIGKVGDARRKGDGFIIVSGGLNHLGSLVDKLLEYKQGAVIFIENEFNLEKFVFCRRRRIPFLVLQRPCQKSVPISKSVNLFPNGDFIFEGRDFAPFFAAAFEEGFKRIFRGLDFDVKQLEALFECYMPQAIILDEEWAMRRILSVFAHMHDFKCFVVSHGVPGMPILDETRQKFAKRYLSGVTFVNSELERSQYESILYSPEKILLLGTPRYDAAFELSRFQYKSSRTVLYCGAHTKPFDFEDLLPWMGLRFVFLEYAELFLRDLFQVVSECPGAQLHVRPHYHDERNWRALASRCAPSNASRWNICSHRENIFRLIAQADVVVTAESTVVVDAILLGKPVILLCYPPDKLTVAYHHYDVVIQVKNAGELRDAMQRCLYDESFLAAWRQKREKDAWELIGPFDGRNSERVARYVKGDMLENRS